MAPLYPPVEAVIFDMDGLLVDSEPFWREVETARFAEVDVDITPFLGHGLTMGMRVDEAVAFLCSCAGAGAVDQAALTKRIVEGVVACVVERAELLEGSLAALDFCEENGLLLALASGSTPPVIEAVLERFSLARRFPVVCSAADDLYGKPHPSIFLRTAEALATDPRHCIVVEDSLNGCIAAKAARMRVVAVPHARDFNDARFGIADVKLATLADFDTALVRELLSIGPHAPEGPTGVGGSGRRPAPAANW